MNDSTLLLYGAFVFVMMLTGLTLTYFEFRYGQPSREDELARTANIPAAKAAPHVIRRVIARTA